MDSDLSAGQKPIHDTDFHVSQYLALNDLSAAAAQTALHNSAARSNAPRCHRNTRVKYLEKLERWMLGGGDDYDGKHLIWLNGGAGVGKSAIMQSIVEQCAQHAVILGSFFFFRSDSSRNYAEVLIPTLAYQLARAFPAALAVLEPIISRDPLIFTSSLHTQAYELLVRPILHLYKHGIIENNNPRRRVFVIDGLDECSDLQNQALIINTIASILCDYDVPISFLIASRPELAISSAFQKEKRLHLIFASISLDDNIDAESDIRQFIEDSFLDILDSHPWRRHIKLPWPKPSSVTVLVRKSSGHFIYAATAMQFIASSDEHPERALDVVEGLKPSRTEQPFSQLDALYLHILSSAIYSNQVLAILRHCHLSPFEPSVAAVCCVHDMTPRDVELFLSDVQPLVSLSPNDIGEMHLRWKHASLRDFLMDEKRSQTLYITRGEYFACFLEIYFRLLDNSPQAPISTYLYVTGGGGVHALIDAMCEAMVSLAKRRFAPVPGWWALSKGHLGLLCGLLRRFAKHTSQGNSHLLALRICIADKNNTLYIHQFKMYMQLTLDDLNESNLTWLTVYLNIFATGFTSGAPMCLPQSQFAWSAELAITMMFTLKELVGLLSLHSDKVPRASESNLGTNDFIWSRRRGRRIHTQRWKCRVLLKAVIVYLPKSDCTRKVVKQARRLLPKAALWHPKLMKRARAEMDAYVRHWEDSTDGLLEKARLLSINNVD
ncbi:hypothetical protein D9619_000477 [Psilocybe cf. subviscida]|uniref:NACHT domain-containing protein n=1 Tax=Psilocybe cf. subviscida TaxID=2480587 RepID=A0A8H5BFK2_9AGAR|nr:hypothetical protein D9619_000477 [Psilocybe cf. subviscida]